MSFRVLDAASAPIPARDIPGPNGINATLSAIDVPTLYMNFPTGLSMFSETAFLMLLAVSEKALIVSLLPIGFPDNQFPVLSIKLATEP